MAEKKKKEEEDLVFVEDQFFPTQPSTLQGLREAFLPIKLRGKLSAARKLQLGKKAPKAKPLK